MKLGETIVHMGTISYNLTKFHQNQKHNSFINAHLTDEYSLKLLLGEAGESRVDPLVIKRLW